MCLVVSSGSDVVDQLATHISFPQCVAVGNKYGPMQAKERTLKCISCLCVCVRVLGE